MKYRCLFEMNDVTLFDKVLLEIPEIYEFYVTGYPMVPCHLESGLVPDSVALYKMVFEFSRVLNNNTVIYNFVGIRT